jgi:phosphoribosylanthranilate isomerase
VVEIKFCGLTRAEDVDYAVALGASYVGAIFAGGPRVLSAGRAAELFVNVPRGVRRVGVFGDQSAMNVCQMATAAQLDIVQLHGQPDAAHIRAIRSCFGGEVWGVARIAGATLPDVAGLFSAADAVLLDAHVPGVLGGTGVALPWRELADELRAVRRASSARVVLAGGLRADNVSDAIRLLSPDAVDVSSGVESAPGIKDHDRMRAFRDAVAAVLTADIGSPAATETGARKST